MASGSCNWPQHRHEHAEDHQHQQPQQRQRHHQYRPHPHQQHKFTSRSCMKQFHNNSLVVFVALALLISRKYPPHQSIYSSICIRMYRMNRDRNNTKGASTKIAPSFVFGRYFGRINIRTIQELSLFARN